MVSHKFALFAALAVLSFAETRGAERPQPKSWPAVPRNLYAQREDDILPASIGRAWVDPSLGRRPGESPCGPCWEKGFDFQLKVTGVELTFRRHGGAQQLPLSVSVDGVACAFLTVIPQSGPLYVPCEAPRFGSVVRVQGAGSVGSAGLSLYDLLEDVRIEEEPTGRHEVPDVRVIICPFLSTLVNEGILHGCTHTEQELMDVTLEAGLDEASAKEHIEGNFQDNPDKVQDICKMEGAVNEHATSTMINDCFTDFEAHGAPVQRQGDAPAEIFPETRIEAPFCGTPNATAFEAFFRTLKQGDTGPLKNFLCKSELEEHADKVEVVDANPIGEGTIAGSFGFLLDVFGEDGCIHKQNLARLLLQRRFPNGFRFGRRHR